MLHVAALLNTVSSSYFPSQNYVDEADKINTFSQIYDRRPTYIPGK